MLVILLSNKNYVLCLASIIFAISLMLFNYAKLPNKSKMKIISKYVPKIKRHLFTYVAIYFIISFICGFLVTKLIVYLNNFTSSQIDIDLINYYIALTFAFISLISSCIFYIINQNIINKSDDISYIMNNLPDAFFKIVYPDFRKNYSKIIINKKQLRKKEEKMEVHIDKVYVSAMNKEALSVFNRYPYILIIICLLILLINILICVIKSKKISLFNLLLLLPILFFVFIIIRNYNMVNSLKDKYATYDTMDIDIKIYNDELIFNNKTLGTTRNVLEGVTIRKIAYKDHVTLVYTTDGRVLMLPNCGNIDSLIK